jgi:hypothetical protein
MWNWSLNFPLLVLLLEWSYRGYVAFLQIICFLLCSYSDRIKAKKYITETTTFWNTFVSNKYSKSI